MSSIEWTDVTWNPIRGCSKVSEGCRHCYAMRQAHRMSGPGHPYEGLTKLTSNGPEWTGKIKVVPELLELPLYWKRPRMIFVNSMSDLFHEDVPEAFLVKIFGIMMRTPRHTFQILTKRPARMADFLNNMPSWTHAPADNIWLGVSVENQKTAIQRIPVLLITSSTVRWISVEPLLGPIVFTRASDSLLSPFHFDCKIDWVVLGGESGPGARPMHPDWARNIRDECVAANVPFFFKQWGEWIPLADDQERRAGQYPDFEKVGKNRAGRLLDGRIWNQYPARAGATRD